MKKRIGLLSSLVSISLVLVILTSCTATMDVVVPLTLSNTSSSTYTIWIGHDTEISPANDITAGSARASTVTLNAKGSSVDHPKDLSDTIKVNVAQDGKLLSTQKLAVEMPYDGAMSLTVIWDGHSFSIQ